MWQLDECTFMLPWSFFPVSWWILLPPVPIIPTFLYSIDHPSPKAQSVHTTPTPRDIYTGPWTEETPYLVSLFDNTTFSVESWMEASPYPKPADWTGLPTDSVNWIDSAVSGGWCKLATTAQRPRVIDSSPLSAELLLSSGQFISGGGKCSCWFLVCI